MEMDVERLCFMFGVKEFCSSSNLKQPGQQPGRLQGDGCLLLFCCSPCLPCQCEGAHLGEFMRILGFQFNCQTCFR